MGVWFTALVVNVLVIGGCLLAGPIGWIVLVAYGSVILLTPSKTMAAWACGMSRAQADEMVRETDAEMERAARSEDEVVDKVRKQRSAS